LFHGLDPIHRHRAIDRGNRLAKFRRRSTRIKGRSRHDSGAALYVRRLLNRHVHLSLGLAVQALVQHIARHSDHCSPCRHVGELAVRPPGAPTTRATLTRSPANTSSMGQTSSAFVADTSRRARERASRDAHQLDF
jgi:hypothetical protein